MDGEEEIREKEEGEVEAEKERMRSLAEENINVRL